MAVVASTDRTLTWAITVSPPAAPAGGNIFEHCANRQTVNRAGAKLPSIPFGSVAQHEIRPRWPHARIQHLAIESAALEHWIRTHAAFTAIAFDDALCQLAVP